MGASQISSYDIAVVGGGLVGASVACALEPLGYRVLLVEQVPFQTSAQPSYDDRTLALSHSSCQILRGLQLWPGLQAHATPIREVIVSELHRPGRVVLQASEMGLAALGHVVEARAFGGVALTRLAQLGGLDIRCPAAVAGIEVNEDCVRLTLREGEQQTSVSARLLVAADGAASAVRRLLGIPAFTRDYGQTAVICNITPEQHHDGRAFERLTRSGPFAVLPYTGDRCGLVWSVPSGDADALLGLAEPEFIARAQQRFGQALGRFLKIGKRSAYPVKLVRAETDLHRRTVILGNAAHAIHPVGAQGFNLGLRDVAVLAEVLSGAAHADPGAADGLSAYSEWRRPDQAETIAWTDGMARLFANPSPAAALLRSAGLILHAVVPPMRRRLASQAMGYHERVPRLAMGLPLDGHR
jgi:2-octaprenyl-6-methoxyphenol hydroxylase